MEKQPAGGFGSGPSQGFGPQGPPPKPSRGGLSTFFAVAGVLLALGSILAVLFVFGIRKYLKGAKTSEAMNTLGQIGKNAAVAYEAEPLDGSWATSAASPSNARPRAGLCRSAKPVPEDFGRVIGTKYQSSREDWASWGCLKFELQHPQYYQYRYDASPRAFTATAQGDLDGNGIRSTFELRGEVVGDELRIRPQVESTNPEE